MAESGCMKSGNFQNLEAQQIVLGGNTLKVAGFVNIDNGGADANAVAATGLTVNAVHIIGGNGTTGATIVTLPDVDNVPNVGDFYTFLIGEPSTAADGHHIRTASAGVAGGILVGSLEYIRYNTETGLALAKFGSTGAANDQTSAVYIAPVKGTSEMICLDSDIADGGGLAGSWVTVTYIGTPDKTNPTWYINGQVFSIDPNGTGEKVFKVFA